MRFASAGLQCIDHALTLDDETLRWMAQQAIENAAQFSVDRMCDQTLDVYNEVLHRPVTAPRTTRSVREREHAA